VDLLLQDVARDAGRREHVTVPPGARQDGFPGHDLSRAVGPWLGRQPQFWLSADGHCQGRPMRMNHLYRGNLPGASDISDSV
jgi:hypothetical protein